uniref:Centrosomal protein kizuna n=1 Tax=Ciona savignyi TaxID=51511 RepID=H2YPS0_CIOSA
MNNLQVYEKQVKFQEHIAYIQNEHKKTEYEFYRMVQNDTKLNSVYNAKLRSYWKKICEKDLHARKRNSELMKDFNQLKLQITELQSQTNKLQTMKKQYEEVVLKLYPNWHQELALTFAKKRLPVEGLSNFSPTNNNKIGKSQSCLTPMVQATCVASTNISAILSPDKPSYLNYAQMPKLLTPKDIQYDPSESMKKERPLLPIVVQNEQIPGLVSNDVQITGPFSESTQLPTISIRKLGSTKVPESQE